MNTEHNWASYMGAKAKDYKYTYKVSLSDGKMTLGCDNRPPSALADFGFRFTAQSLG